MDLPLWDSSASYNYESENNTEDNCPGNFSLGYGRDMLEEEAVNVKSCLQVLKIWNDKEDKDIAKLEDDLLMLQCKLAWDDEVWSKQCSAALREKIGHLDNLIQSLKKDDGHLLETEELPPTLHDLLKPLLENYLANRKQTETSIIQMPVQPAVELGNKKSEANTSNDNKKMDENVSPIMLKTYERKSKCTELEGRKINHPLQKKDAVTTGFNASAHTCPHDEVSENFRIKPNTPVGRIMPNLVHVKSEPDPMVNESSVSTSIVKANSTEGRMMPNLVHVKSEPADPMVNESSVSTSIVKANSTEGRIMPNLVHVKSEPADPMVNESSVSTSIVKANSTEGRIMPNLVHVNSEPTDPMVNESSVSTSIVKDNSREREVKRNNENKAISKAKFIQEGIIHEVKVTNSHLKLQEIGSQITETVQVDPKKQRTEAPNKVQKARVYRCGIIDKGASSTTNLAGHIKNVVAEGMSKKDKKETQQQLNENNIAGASEGNATPILLLQEVSQLSFNSQTTDEKGESSVMNVVTKEATCGVNNEPEIPSLCTMDKEKLTISNLKAIAKSRNLRGYSKLKKEELRKLLDL